MNCVCCLSVGRVYIAQVATKGKLMFWGAKVRTAMCARYFRNYNFNLRSELLYNLQINEFVDEGQLWRLVTSAFLHANVGHLLVRSQSYWLKVVLVHSSQAMTYLLRFDQVNCYSLNAVGPSVEKISGTGRYLAVYLASAIASNRS